MQYPHDPIQCLYPHPLSHEDVPKDVSGRTRYLRVCLDFHSYPQLIASVFNLSAFGPSGTFTSPSTWPWIDHSLSRLPHTTKVAHFALAFAMAPPLKGLTEQYTVTRRLIMQKARSHPLHTHCWYRPYGPLKCHRAPTACKFMVSGSISLPLQGFFSPFAHATASLSVVK